MVLSGEKLSMFNEYNKNYDAHHRIGFCNIALKKYKWEKYQISDNNIKQEDMIIQDNDTRQYIQSIINNNSCTVDEFRDIFTLLTIDQINYIGF
jgi:hypothetical protein